MRCSLNRRPRLLKNIVMNTHKNYARLSKIVRNFVSNFVRKYNKSLKNQALLAEREVDEPYGYRSLFQYLISLLR